MSDKKICRFLPYPLSENKSSIQDEREELDMELGKIEFMIQRKGMELRNLRATYDLVKGRRILLSDLTNIDDLAMVIGWHPIQESEFKALTRFIE